MDGRGEVDEAVRADRITGKTYAKGSPDVGYEIKKF